MEYEQEQDEPRIDIHRILEADANGDSLVDLISDEDLKECGRSVLEAFDRDIRTREGWSERNKEAIKLAMQVSEDKTWPWPGASNIKFPQLTVATQQFASRIVPALIRMPYPVSSRINGYKTPEKSEAGERMAKYMSWQLTDDMDYWVEEQDQLCHVVPICGCAFKKTYRDFSNKKNVSELVLPDRVVFDYYAKNVETARTVTHWFYEYEQEIIEKQRLGIYRDVDVSTDRASDIHSDFETRDAVGGTEARDTEGDSAIKILEQCCWYDLDDDGYEEPYICTVVAKTGEVLRIVPRFTAESVKMVGDKIGKITPDVYYTQYIFLPDPSGGNLGIGWGTILFPLNETVNTLLNQLVDAGTINNLGGGIIGNELRLPSGDIKNRPGQWLRVNNMGGDIGRSVYPWPQQPPSQVLFQILALLIDWGQRITSVSDAMMGESPPSNVPATTTLALLEQGQKVFHGIYLRFFRSMTRELRKLKDLNRRYMNNEEYYQVIDYTPVDEIDEKAMMLYQQTGKLPPTAGVAYRSDFDRDDTDITLTADQQMSSDQYAMAQLQVIMQFEQTGTQFLPEFKEKLMVSALKLPPSMKGQILAPPQPNPEMMMKAQEIQAKTQLDQQRIGVESQRAMTEDKRVDQERLLASAKLRLEHRRDVVGMAMDNYRDHRAMDIQESQTQDDDVQAEA